MSNTRPRLSKIDPDALGKEVSGWVTEHIMAQALHVGIPDITLEPRMSALALPVAELTRYAQEGPPHCDDGGPVEYIQTVLQALHTSAHPDGFQNNPTAFDWLSSDAERPIDIVLLAADARQMLTIANPQPVPMNRLAALGGCAIQYIWDRVSKGALKSVKKNKITCISPGSAKSWLAVRKVPGFERGK